MPLDASICINLSKTYIYFCKVLLNLFYRTDFSSTVKYYLVQFSLTILIEITLLYSFRK